MAATGLFAQFRFHLVNFYSVLCPMRLQACGRRRVVQFSKRTAYDTNNFAHRLLRSFVVAAAHGSSHLQPRDDTERKSGFRALPDQREETRRVGRTGGGEKEIG